MPDPLHARLDQLHDQWVSFADDPHARLLVWNARDDERAMVDGFLGDEADPDRAHTPDIFLELTTPWTEPSGHGERLAQELVAQAAELDWQLAYAGADLAALLSALEALRARLGERLLAVRLEPSAIEGEGYLLWLQRLAHAAPQGVRFLVIGSGYGELSRAEPIRVRAVDCALDMPDAFEELTDRIGGATPDNVFRRLQMRLNAQLHAGDLTGARDSSQQAITLASEQGWPQVAAAMHMVMGAAYVGQTSYAEAVAAYGEAERLACQVEGAEGPKLRLLAALGTASVLLAAQLFERASASYRRAAMLAAELGDARCELDGYRMSAHCCAQLGERERAWSDGIAGLRAASKLAPEQRASSTLQALAAQLQRLFRGDARVRALNQQLARLAEA